jgi:hypothetical protein
MEERTRREALYLAGGLGLVAAAGAAPAAADDRAKEVGPEERERVRKIWMTEEEADCWVLAANLAGRFFALPKMHPMDAQEVATAIHVIQNKLLSRPTYRRYLEAARAQKK